LRKVTQRLGQKLAGTDCVVSGREKRFSKRVAS
jgi:hypothetical protein